MKARLHSLWQKIKKPLEILSIVIVCISIIVLLVVIALAYLFNVNIAGLYGKTIWDWLQLLIIPAVLAIGGYLFNFTTGRNERQASEKSNQTERDIALDNQRETALQSYIDKISDLLLDRRLRESQPQDEVRTIARVRTLTTLPHLDATRKGSVVRFLYESQLINKDNTIIDLEGADLRVATLSFINLCAANLRGANLRGANLNEANLSKADLSLADLNEADLSLADLNEADLSKANLFDANLYGTKLIKANLREAFLFGADLREANLHFADLREADLREANLRYADLSKANVIQAQLDQTQLLEYTIMPNGSLHVGKFQRS